MSTESRYAIPTDEQVWNVPGRFDTAFSGNTRTAGNGLLSLYEKGKEQHR